MSGAVRGYSSYALPGGGGGSGASITEIAVNLAANITTGAQPPIYTTLLTTGVFNKKRADTNINVFFSAAWLYSGAAAVIAANFRARLDDAALLAAGAGCTSNEIGANRIKSVTYRAVGVPGIVAGAHTIRIEWGYFGPAGRTLSISALALPDLQHASLLVQEVLP